MALRVGNNEITQIGKVKRGNDNVVRIYRGNDLIFPIFENTAEYIIIGNFNRYKDIDIPTNIMGLQLTDGTTNNSFNGSNVIQTGSNIRDVLMYTDSNNEVKILVGRVTAGTDALVSLKANGTINNNFTSSFDFTGLVPQVYSITRGSGSFSNIFYIGGTFNKYNGQDVSGLIGINESGQLLTIFSGINLVFAIKQQASDGKIVVGGSFGIRRYNTNGTVDNTFSLGSNFNAAVRDLAILPDGKILCVGDFTSYNGTPCGHIARLNINGTYDTTFNLGVNNEGFNGNAYAIEFDSFGNYYIGGLFTSYRASASLRMVKILPTGFKDNNFSVEFEKDVNGNTLGNTQVNFIKRVGAFSFVVGGDFNRCNGQIRNRIVQINDFGVIVDSNKFGTGFTRNTFDQNTTLTKISTLIN
jgi:hypothetical protein